MPAKELPKLYSKGVSKVKITRLKKLAVSNFAPTFSNFMNFHKLVKNNNVQYPFMVMNTDRDNKNGTHWWSLLELYTHRNTFLFDRFGFTGFKEFIIDNDHNIINKLV